MDFIFQNTKNGNSGTGWHSEVNDLKQQISNNFHSSIEKNEGLGNNLEKRAEELEEASASLFAKIDKNTFGVIDNEIPDIPLLERPPTWIPDADAPGKN